MGIKEKEQGMCSRRFVLSPPTDLSVALEVASDWLTLRVGLDCHWLPVTSIVRNVLASDYSACAREASSERHRTQ